MNREQEIQLAELVDMENPGAVLEEVKNIFVQHYRIAEFRSVRMAFNDFVRLFAGTYPGYRACNTRYHDVRHSTDALMAMARLIDGYIVSGRRLPSRAVQIGLIAAIFHDAGYIQKRSDTRGTGAKYTMNHVDRSVEFVAQYFSERGYTAADQRMATAMIRCTGLNTEITTGAFSSEAERVLGLMLGAADLLGQMSSRVYLERLRYLYQEFREGNVAGFGSEHQLLEKTVQFHAATQQRLAGVLEKIDRHAAAHFKTRYGVRKNLYQIAIERQMNYLRKLLEGAPVKLRRRY
jgi:hypothetical protein